MTDQTEVEKGEKEPKQDRERPIYERGKRKETTNNILPEPQSPEDAAERGTLPLVLWAGHFSPRSSG